MVTKNHDQVQEMKRRIGQGWSAFCKLDNIMPIRLKRKAFNESCILPVMTYGCETWLLSNTQIEKLVTTQWKIERIMGGVILNDRKSTNWIWEQEWCDRHYQEHNRKQTQMGRPRGKET